MRDPSPWDMCVKDTTYTENINSNISKALLSSTFIIKIRKLFAHLLLFGKLFQALMEDSTGMTRQVRGFFGL